MARIRNRRAARTSNSGASWISYSDMMAALLLCSDFERQPLPVFYDVGDENR